METYGNRSGNSGVAAYQLEEDGIVIKFCNGAVYRYTAASAGRESVALMQRLAREGFGLSRYISRHVRGRYAQRLRS